MNSDFIKGIVVPIVTPIKEDESVDEAAFRAHIDYMIDNGVDGILAFGSNGEFYMMEEDEMDEILSIIIDQVKGRVPVYMGIGAIRTQKCVRLAKLALKYKVNGISILQPMFLKPTEEELYLHFKTIADTVPSLPVLLYNNPGRTGYGMSQNLVYMLAHNVKNIVGMKDSSGNLTETEEFIRRNADVDFKVFCGKDTLIYAGLAVGAVGAVCSTANFLPTLVCSIYDRYVSGDVKGSLAAQFELNPIRLEMDKSSFPVATKDYGNLLGRKLGSPYKPTLPSPEREQEGLRKQLIKAGYLK